MAGSIIAILQHFKSWRCPEGMFVSAYDWLRDWSLLHKTIAVQSGVSIRDVISSLHRLYAFAVVRDAWTRRYHIVYHCCLRTCPSVYYLGASPKCLRDGANEAL